MIHAGPGLWATLDLTRPWALGFGLWGFGLWALGLGRQARGNPIVWLAPGAGRCHAAACVTMNDAAEAARCHDFEYFQGPKPKAQSPRETYQSPSCSFAASDIMSRVHGGSK